MSSIIIRSAKKEEAAHIAELFLLAWPVEDISDSNQITYDQLQKFITLRLPVLGRAVMLSSQKVNEGNGQGSRGKIDAPQGVSILLKTYARNPNMGPWEIYLVTYLRGTSRLVHEKNRLLLYQKQITIFGVFRTFSLCAGI